MKPIPFETKPKAKPEETEKVEGLPEEMAQIEKEMQSLQEVETPKESKEKEEKPEGSTFLGEIPVESILKDTKPSDNIESNCVVVDGQKIEIKPTKLKYFRNKAASGYAIIKAVPLPELLTYEKGIIDKERDADQLLYDFLVATFDDSTFVRDHYDEFDADLIDKVCKIFGKVNHIDEKEEAARRKNREAQAKR